MLTPTLVLALPLFLLICGLWIAYLFPRGRLLRFKGMEYSRMGNPAEAEKCYRKCLARGSKVSPEERVRLLVNLGGALMDMGRYPQSEECLNKALTLGDPSGSCNSSIADLLLMQGIQPEKALEMAEKAMELHKPGSQGNLPYDWGERIFHLVHSVMWSQKAWALALLDRKAEAREAIEAGLKLLAAAQAGTPNYYKTSPMVGPDLRTTVRLGVSESEWRSGMALRAMGENDEAAVHFGIARDADPKGKYGLWAVKQLALGPAANQRACPRA